MRNNSPRTHNCRVHESVVSTPEHDDREPIADRSTSPVHAHPADEGVELLAIDGISLAEDASQSPIGHWGGDRP